MSAAAKKLVVVSNDEPVPASVEIEETVIIEVAEEKPPTKAKSARACWPLASGRVRTNMSGLAPAGIVAMPKMAMGRVKRLMARR